MAEDNKPKATLIKQNKPSVQEVPTDGPSSVEKKKVVLIKKKPVVVVKAAAQPKVEEQPAKPEIEAPKKEVKPIPAAPVVQKKVIKRVSQAANTTINNGPKIISGDNLPPIYKDFSSQKNVESKPVGSVGGRNYDRSGGYQGGQNRQGGYQGGQQNRTGGYQGGQNRQGGYQGGQNRTGGYQGGQNRTGGYQGGQNRPGFQGGNRPAGQGGFGPRPAFGQRRPPFGQGGQRPPFIKDGNRAGGMRKPFGSGAAPEAAPIEKNRRNFTKDKDKNKDWAAKYSHEDEDELNKQFGKRSKGSDASGASAIPKSIDILASITVSDLARKMNIKASDIIGKLFSMGMMVSINQSIDSDTASIIAGEYGCSVHLVSLYDETIIAREEESEEDVVPRAPIVTVMGHVDHGKTKLLDAIRSTNVVAGEFGGITQHIGAYKVSIPGRGDIVFLDTPGHAAFTMMRARGAQLTDIVVLVVAANDGVMPQTLEAIDHAKAAKVPIIVAINKIDLPDAKPERVMQQLSDHGLMPEEWGGDTLFCQISALRKEGIENLLDNILLQAEVLDLKANPNCRAEGKILESRIDQGRGIVASVIVERGTVHQGDYYVAGIYPGRVRAMFDDKGKKISEAGPSTPVEIIGLSDVPSAGDPFQVTENEKQARQVGAKRQELERLGQASKFKKVTLDNLYDKIHEGEVKELNVIIKGDVQGSVEALQQALEKLSTAEIRLRVIRAAAGAIIEDDINLASASENSALVIGFNVRPTPKAQARADQDKIEIRKYNIIYNAVDDVRAAMEGMLSPEKTEIDVGTAQVRQVFKVPKIGLIAGCYVLSGSVKRSNFCRVIRDHIQINKDLVKISSLKRFKDDVREVAAGFECGIGIENFQDLQENDTLEFVEIKETARKLEDSGEYI